MGGHIFVTNGWSIEEFMKKICKLDPTSCKLLLQMGG